MKIDPEVTAEANLNWEAGRFICQLGISDVFFSPGSRSTPLILGFERNTNFSTYPVLDERSAAFIALGFSKRTSKPTILVVHQAHVNSLFPAVVEASHSAFRYFYYLLTDSRITKLWCWSNYKPNQFIWVICSFFSSDLPTSTKNKTCNKLIKSINEAFLNCLGQNPGPVHLNFPLENLSTAKLKPLLI